MKLLHLLRRPPGHLSRRVIEKQGQEHEITIVLLQEARAIKERLPGKVLILHDDLRKRGASTDLPEIGYGKLLRLIFEHDRVFCW